MSTEIESNEDAVTRLKDSVQTLKEDVADLQSRASARLNDLKEKSQVYREKGGEVIDSLGEYCKENPQQAAIVAGAAGLGIGVILGLLMRGK